MNIFEQGTRMKVRFQTTKGALQMEDLWTLPLVVKKEEVETRSGTPICLDDIAIDLHKQIEAAGTVSFVKKKSDVNALLQLKLDIVKHVIDTKMAEDAQKATIDAKRRRLKELMEIESDKENAALKEMPLEVLKKEIAQLQAEL